MAMNKKEQAEMEELKNQLLLTRAFRFTDKVKKDVMPPQGSNNLSTGWVYNAPSKRVEVACSSAIHHARGQTDKTNTQNPISMYSSKLLALKAMRNELEQKFAKELADVDKRIEEESEVTP